MDRTDVIRSLIARRKPFLFYFDINSDFKRTIGIVDCTNYIFYNTKKIKIFEHSAYIEDIEIKLNEILKSD